MSEIIELPKMNIYQRLNEVRKAVAYVRKEKKVESYLAVTHDQVTGEVRDHFIQHGIQIVPSLVSASVKDTGTTTSKGTPFIRYEAIYRFNVVNIDEPADCFSADIESHALDHGDKAPGKALSYAKKAFVLKLLEIESGEGEEERPDVKAAKSAKSGAAAAGIELMVPPERHEFCYRVAATVRDCIEAGQLPEAIKALEQITDAEEKILTWKQLDSKDRSLIKRTMTANREKADATV